MSSEHLAHIQKGDLGEVTLIVGDPDRVALISKDWESKRKIEDSREFVLVVGMFRGHHVSVCSTGMGVGSTENLSRTVRNKLFDVVAVEHGEMILTPVISLLIVQWREHQD